MFSFLSFQTLPLEFRYPVAFWLGYSLTHLVRLLLKKKQLAIKRNIYKTRIRTFRNRYMCEVAITLKCSSCFVHISMHVKSKLSESIGKSLIQKQVQKNSGLPNLALKLSRKAKRCHKKYETCQFCS